MLAAAGLDVMGWDRPPITGRREPHRSLDVESSLGGEKRLRVVLSMILVIALLPIPVRLTAAGIRALRGREGEGHEMAAVRALTTPRPRTPWVFTDLPIYAFYARLKVPPEIAVLSKKRLESGAVKEEDLVKVLETYEPERILMGRKLQGIDGAFESHVRTNYRETYRNEDVVVLRRSVGEGR